MLITFRQADPADLDFARALYLESSRWLIEHYFGWDEAREIEKFPQQFDASRSRIIQVDGWDSGWLQAYETEERFEIDSLYIVKNLRGHGIGTRILQNILQDAGGKPVTLSTAKINPALELYKRLGFQIVREEERKFFLQAIFGQNPEQSARSERSRIDFSIF